MKLALAQIESPICLYQKAITAMPHAVRIEVARKGTSFNTRPAKYALPLMPDSQEHDEALQCLMKSLVAGERAALRLLYELTAPLLFSLARRVLANSADAEEVICDAYKHAWQCAAQYDVSRGSVRAWLMVICRSRAIDRCRKDKSRRRSEDASELAAQSGLFGCFGPEDSVDALQRRSAIHDAMAQLSPLRRRLVTLAFFQGMSHLEVAVATNLALGTVKSHIRRALATLRQELETTRRNKEAANGRSLVNGNGLGVRATDADSLMSKLPRPRTTRRRRSKAVRALRPELPPRVEGEISQLLRLAARLNHMSLVESSAAT